MITAPVSKSVSPTTSCNCSIAFPIQAKTCDTSPCLSAIKPSSETDRPNRTFPMVFSNLCECSPPRQPPRNKQPPRRETKQLLRSCSREKQKPHTDISEKRARNGSVRGPSRVLALDPFTWYHLIQRCQRQAC